MVLGCAHNRSRSGRALVILSAAKDLGGAALRQEILRYAQDDGLAVNDYASRVISARKTSPYTILTETRLFFRE